MWLRTDMLTSGTGPIDGGRGRRLRTAHLSKHWTRGNRPRWSDLQIGRGANLDVQMEASGQEVWGPLGAPRTLAGSISGGQVVSLACITSVVAQQVTRTPALAPHRNQAGLSEVIKETFTAFNGASGSQRPGCPMRSFVLRLLTRCGPLEECPLRTQRQPIQRAAAWRIGWL